MAGNRLKKLGWMDYLSVAMHLATSIAAASMDGKITVSELVGIAVDVAIDLGYDVEKEGVKLDG